MIIIGSSVVLLVLFIVWYIIRRELIYSNIAKFEYNMSLFEGPFGHIIKREKSGLASYIKDSHGIEHWFEYDNKGRLISYKDSEGQHYKYRYKGNMRLRKID